jgi:hypothetical protein
LINWFVGSKVSRAASFGGRDFFKPENNGLTTKFGKNLFTFWRNVHGIETPFTDDTDLMDNQVSIFEYRNKVRVQFQCTMSNAIPERRMYFTCSEGSIIVDLYTSDIRWKALGDDEVYHVSYGLNTHAGGDSYIMKELFETMTTGVAPKCSGDEGLESAVLAIGLDQAAVSGKIFDYEPVWKKLGR